MARSVLGSLGLLGVGVLVLIAVDFCLVFGVGLGVISGVGLGVISRISGGAGERRSEARHVLAPALVVLAVSRASVFLDAEGAARFTVGLTLARVGLAAKGTLSLTSVLFALALARRPCIPRVRSCLALIKLGGQRAIRRYTVHFLMNVKRDVALQVALGQAPERGGGPFRGPHGLFLPGLSS